jgi:hypothetical protein
MTADTLNQLLQHPEKLSEIPQEQLQQLVDKYPYCNCFRLLHVKKLKNVKHISFERHFALASTYASDRRRLFDFMHSAKSFDKSTQSIGTAFVHQKKKYSSIDLVNPPSIYIQKVSQNPPLVTFELPLAVPQKQAVAAYEDEHDFNLSNMPIEEWLLDFEPPRIEEKKVSSSKKSFKLSRIPKLPKNLLAFLDEDKEKNPNSRDKQVEDKGPDKPDKIIETPPVTTDSSPQIDANQMQQKDSTTPEPDVFDVFINDTKSFLKRINDKNKSEESEEEYWEDDSIEENREIVSETLATILAIQGQKAKSIKMYEALSLKFPEKSRLFAEKINELK